MSLSRRTADALLGLFLVSAVVVIVVAVIFTQGWNERRIILHILTNSAQDLNLDTKVFLQGLEVGRVTKIVPKVDRGMGPLKFVATIRVRAHYPDGAQLSLPAGTSAEIRTKTLGGGEVSLVLPEQAAGELHTGDTITSFRRTPALEAIARVADSLATQVKLVLGDTRTLIRKLTETAELANAEVGKTAPEVRQTLVEIENTLTQLRPALAQATTLMTTANQRVGVISDSVATTLSEAHGLLGNLDSLTTTARNIAQENQAEIKQVMANLNVVSAKLGHFFDQVTRRPLRMITGVRALPPESLQVKP